MQYTFYEDFAPSLQVLYGKGGPFKKAAETVMTMRDKIANKFNDADIFSVAKTHSGEDRISHCRKYDLTGRARLITVCNNGICMFLFAGDHDASDRWLQKNRGIDFIARDKGKNRVIEPVYISNDVNKAGHIMTANDLGAPDRLFDLISDRHLKRLLDGLPEAAQERIAKVNAVSVDDEVLDAVDAIEDYSRKKVVLDVLLSLRAGNANAAKNRIDEYVGEVKRLAYLSEHEVSELISGEHVIKVEDVNGEAFDNFIRTADYRKWMLYLHPSQREYADREAPGSMRISGVSGSGKTCVLIHRAVRLAEKYPDQKILVLTLNAALATLIDSLVNASRSHLRPTNLRVSSFWEICREKLLAIEPENNKLYAQTTIATNPYAVEEHIDDIWDEYYNCENNNHDAELMYPLHRSLLARGIFPKDYIKQEFDYVRSALAPSDRKKYLEMERAGRAIPLDKSFRTQVFDGLASWESKMAWVGAIDATAITTALYRHLDRLSPEYRCVLIDEVQDFGTLELSIVRRLVAKGENDLMLCGDAAQSVYTKYQDMEVAGINVRGGRSMRLQQNYRNSRQILIAAHDILTRNFERRSKGVVDIEILLPEFADFSSSKPNLLSAASFTDELEYALGYANAVVVEHQHKKVCIAVAGYHQRGVESLGKRVGLPVLNGEINLAAGFVFLSDLEQTKGFEFDSMIIVNAHSGVLPHPDLPREESFRDLSKFYVAMTRAKIELIVSYHGTVTDFVGDNQEHFAVGEWADYAERQLLGPGKFPAPGVVEKRFGREWELTGKQFLQLPEAVGLSLTAQEKLIECVTGNISFEGKQKRQKSWKSIGEFLNDMRKPLNRRHVSLSDEAWQTIVTHFGQPVHELKTHRIKWAAH